jgi:hypothetical protein
MDHLSVREFHAFAGGVSVMRRGLFAVCAGLLQSACTHGGDFVTYAVWNRSSDHEIEDARMVAADDAKKRPTLFTASFLIALPVGAEGWSFGGVTNLPDSGHHMPDRIAVTWRLPPKPGQEAQKGDLIGPYYFDLAKEIPADVRRMVRAGKDYHLHIGVAGGIEPATLRWRLVEWRREDTVGSKELRRGGDW